MLVVLVKRFERRFYTKVSKQLSRGSRILGENHGRLCQHLYRAGSHVT